MSSTGLRLGLVACLLLSGCGLRLEHGTRQALLHQALQGGSAGQPGVTTPGTDGPTTGPDGSRQATTNRLTGRTGAPGTASGGGARLQGPVVGSTAPPGGNGGATDVGVTATTVTVGTVADQSGPQPGLFDGDIAGARAYFAYVNSQGGVNGRLIKQKVADSALECNQTSNAYNAMVPTTFAFVANLSIFDNCGAAVLRAHPEMPDTSLTLTTEHTNAPSTFSTQPSVPGGRPGPPLVYAAAFPEVKAAVGGLYPDVPGAKSQWESEKAMLLHLGFTVVYDQAIPPTTVDYTQYVIGMRQKNVKMAILFNTAANNAKFVNAAQQQGFTPPVIEAPGTLYDPSFRDAVGTSVTDAYVDTTTALYADPAEAKAVKGVALYQQWMRKSAPEQALDQFSTFGWMEAALFVQALRAAGPKLTRKSLIKALRNTHSVDTGGLVVSGDPGAGKAASCYLLAHYVNGVWKRWRSPASGFMCNQPYYVVKG